MRRPSKRKYSRRNLYIPDEIWELAERRSNSKHRSVSSYFTVLILKDAGKLIDE